MRAILIFAPTGALATVGGAVAWTLSSSVTVGNRLIAVGIGVITGAIVPAVLVQVVVLVVRVRRARSRVTRPQVKTELPPSDYDDPGWPLDLRFLVPILGAVRMIRAKRAPNGLTSLRTVYVSLVVAPFLLLYVLTQVHPRNSTVVAPWVMALILAVLGAQSLLYSRSLAHRTPPIESARALLTRYRAIFFLRFATAETPMLIGFLAYFIEGGRLWLYFVGLGFTAAALLLMAPTATSIRRRQLDIAASGAQLSLGRLLTLPAADQQKIVRGEVPE